MVDDKKLLRIVKTVLTEHFDDIKIESINIRPDVDEDGEEILIVKVVFDGRHKQLDPAKTSSLLRHIRPKIAEIGEYAFPVISFIAKSELGKVKPDAV